MSAVVVWARYKKNYGAGPWSRWHERTGSTRTLCGEQLPAHRLVLRTHQPRKDVCGGCLRLRMQRTRMAAKRAHAERS